MRLDLIYFTAFYFGLPLISLFEIEDVYTKQLVKPISRELTTYAATLLADILTVVVRPAALPLNSSPHHLCRLSQSQQH